MTALKTEVKTMLQQINRDALIHIKLKSPKAQVGVGDMVASADWSKIVGGKRVRIKWSRTANIISVETNSNNPELCASFTFHIVKECLLTYHGVGGSFNRNKSNGVYNGT